jgi:CheY-like chemotaxis protein
MEAIGQLTGGIAHDFNNLLTSIMGYVALAAERDTALADERLGSYLAQARKSCERARDLIQQMLTFSRGQRGSPRAVSLAAIVRDSAATLRAGLPGTLELAVEVDAAVPPVHVDPVQVEQVLLNLCINARDAVGGSGRVRVGVRALRAEALVCEGCRAPVDGEFVELAVEDDGCGIAPELIEHIFEPFFSTKAAGEGSGMGLAMVHGIVHEHGGHVLVRSRVGSGTRFSVLWPALSASAAAVESRDPELPPPKPVRPALAGSVLVVDDEESVGEFMRELLGSWGLDAQFAPAPEAALEALRAAPARFDVVITDHAMPRMSGLELAGHLKAIRPELPVILYTGYGDGLAGEALEAARLCAVLRKPVDPELLAQTLARCVGIRERR